MVQFPPPIALSAFPILAGHAQVDPVARSGGLSAARIWRVGVGKQDFALRRWPPKHPTRERLEFLHALQKHVFDVGFPRVPMPQATAEGGTIWEHAGHLWELTTWLPGAPLAVDPRVGVAASERAKVPAALAALAEFHAAAASFERFPAQRGLSAGLSDRATRVAELAQGGLARLKAAVSPSVWPEGVEPTRQILALYPLAVAQFASKLHAAAAQTVMLQACLRDVWSNHVLFVGEKVTGLIDFGAARPESPAGDIARLLGSFALDEPALWQAGLAAYEAVRPLDDELRQLVVLFDRSTVLLAGLNWIEWIFVEHRQFADLPQIAARLEGYAARLAHLAREVG